MIRMVDASEKYGHGQQMIVADEPIGAGEKIWWCNCGDEDYMMSRDEILRFIRNRPELKNFLCWYSYMVNFNNSYDSDTNLSLFFLRTSFSL